MYYNGDAIWYFLTEIYPMLIKEAQSSLPITIAGRSIPSELRETVQNGNLVKNVTFIESPNSVQELYDKARIVIAPHLYGAGIQYKVSEAFSFGVPVVMSSCTADSFGIESEDEVGCIGRTSESFKTCILEVYYNKEKWTKLSSNEIDFIRRTHSREKVMSKWRHILD